ncbi:MAG: AEC family transporter [Peptostreptococcaceae bacterium]|nr:AEC family transporter [Peptostreptococcaceae bacterium]
MSVFSQIFALFLMMGAGFIVRKKNLITDTGVSEMSRLLLYVTLPALIIKAMQFEIGVEEMMRGMKMPLLALILYTVCIGLAFLTVRLMKLSGKQADVLRCCLIFPNVSFMGYPVVLSIYGEEGMFYAALFNMFFDLLIWTVGIAILSRSADRKQKGKSALASILNPGTAGVLIGLSLFFFSIDLPVFISDTLTYLSRATVPIAMICIGALLSQSSVSDVVGNKKLIFVSLVKMILFPLIVLLILKAAGMSGYFLTIPVIMMAMPSAANVAVFSAKLESDAVLASQGVFLTTLMSLVTIPVLVNWIR